jgi:hypothetical protein
VRLRVTAVRPRFPLWFQLPERATSRPHHPDVLGLRPLAFCYSAAPKAAAMQWIGIRPSFGQDFHSKKRLETNWTHRCWN